MKRIFFLLLICCGWAIASAQWRPDILGDGYEMRYVDQPDDYAGKVRCTIVRKLADCPTDKGVLYVHGFNDYFFQAEMGDRFVDSCYNFYAVDLRKYGRSIMEGQKKFQVRNMKEYFADIDSALAQMKHDGNKEIVLMGHSTGGLTTSLYMNDNPDTLIRALILNSPFLDWNQSATQEKFLIPMVRGVAKLFPNISIAQGGGDHYARSLLAQYDGEWTYDTSWKLSVSPNVDSGWIRAIDVAQSVIQDDPNIRVPILLMHSDRSYKKGDSDSLYLSTDAVLDVEDISRYGRRLGPSVTEITVHGGLHDLVLSRKGVREPLYIYIFQWLDRQGL